MTWTVEMFHDGDCPLCEREVRVLKRLDRSRGKVRFTDIASPTFDDADYGFSRGHFMARIRARTFAGEWLDGVDVFRALYTAVGFGWAVRLSTLPGVREALDVFYDLFARNRLRLTGRDDACATTCALEAP